MSLCGFLNSGVEKTEEGVSKPLPCYALLLWAPD